MQFVGAQAVHLGMGQLSAVDRPPGPGYSSDDGAFCRGQFNVIMSADAVGLFLQASYPLQQFVPILFATGLEETGCEFGQSVFKDLDEPVGHSCFFPACINRPTVAAVSRSCISSRS